jgi:small GTP-binding protein
VLQKKICMVGSFAVGKTSLVSAFVHSIFSEKYLTTLGVKIDKKVVEAEGRQVTLILWDLAGEDEFMQVRMSYLRGSAGYLLVIDGTRRSTFDVAITLQKRVDDEVGQVPFIVLLNKADLAEQWEVSAADIESLTERGWKVIRTSAKTGSSVEDAFSQIARTALQQSTEVTQ